MTDPSVVGVDGCAGAWVAAVVDGAGVPALRWCADFEEVVAVATAVGASVVGVDMPIGLPEDGPRASDTAARALLGARRSTLFPTPMRAVLEAVDYQDALARSRAACGKGLSVQAWNLVPAIRQVRTAALVSRSSSGPLLIEVHPETSFAAMAGQPLVSKRTPDGVRARRAALIAAFDGLRAVDLGDPVGLVEPVSAAPGTPIGRIGVDDVLDALAAAWSARRFASSEAMVLGEGIDRDGLSLTLVV